MTGTSVWLVDLCSLYGSNYLLIIEFKIGDQKKKRMNTISFLWGGVNAKLGWF